MPVKDENLGQERAGAAAVNVALTPTALTTPEVERLMAQVASRDRSSTVYRTGGRVDTRPRDSIQAFDFRQPAFLNMSELRKLRSWHEEFGRALAARLSLFLRLDVAVQITRLQTLPYHKFIEGVPNPVYLTFFKVEPLRGVALLEVPLKLGLAMVDRLLGGPDQTVQAAPAAGPQREPSEIELALLEELAEVILGEWTGHWAQRRDLRAVVLGHESNETNARHVHSPAQDAVMLVLGLEARLGDCVETMQMAFPHSLLEPLVPGLGVREETGDPEPAPAQAGPLSWNHALNDLEIAVSAEWNGMEVAVRDLAQLKPGDLIELRPDAAANVQLRLGEALKFAGRLGTVRDSWAVEITQFVKT